MSVKKLLTLLLISFVATSVVIYQLQNRRRPAPRANLSMPAPESSGAAAVDPSPSAQPEPEISIPDTSLTPINIPANGWGRNPFISIEEINAANAPDPAPVVQQTPSAPLRVEPGTGLPIYIVSAILSGPQGRLAVIDSRVLREGDRIGQETVKEIKPESVVLEHEGRARELVMKSFADAVRRSAPGKGDKL